MLFLLEFFRLVSWFMEMDHSGHFVDFTHFDPWELLVKLLFLSVVVSTDW